MPHSLELSTVSDLHRFHLLLQWNTSQPIDVGYFQYVSNQQSTAINLRRFAKSLKLDKEDKEVIDVVEDMLHELVHGQMTMEEVIRHFHIERGEVGGDKMSGWR